MAASRRLAALVALLVVAVMVVAARADVRVEPAGGGAPRRLLQSGTCPNQIPRCAANRCSAQVISGKTQSVCERCQPTYVPANNGLNCICPPGSYEACASGACSCVLCEKGFFCEGGDKTAKNGAPVSSFGRRTSCIKGANVPAGSTTTTTATIQAAGITTKARGSRRFTDCVPTPGYFLTAMTKALQQASPCPPLTYSPGFGRIRACFSCQSGTLENPAVTLAVRSDKLQVCQVPPGRYIVQNVVRDCPPGTFRTSFARADEVAATKCLPCPPGTTTNVSGPTSAAACKVVLPGVKYNSDDLSSAQATAAAGDSGLLTDPPQCPYGFYCPGGILGNSGSVAGTTSNSSAIACPYGTTTEEEGATSVDECMVPPGYFVKLPAAGATTGTLQRCPGDIGGQGYYRVGWVSYKDVTIKTAGDGSAACTPCGAGIKSDSTDVDEMNGGEDPTIKVPASSFACYIEDGWGMVPTGAISAAGLLQYKANLCEVNSYGVANRTYGLFSASCKPCQRNLITIAAGSTSWTDCINPDGFGYGSGGAMPCPVGSWAAQGSMQPCQKCPAGRTTTFGVPSQQSGPDDCLVNPGSGIYDGNSTNPWDPSTSGNAAQDATLTVLPCPQGYFSAGGGAATKCTPCDAGYTTISEGTVGGNSTVACTKCAAGFGKQDGSTECTACAAGSYSPGYNGEDNTGASGDGETCLSCVPTMYVFVSSSGSEPPLNSTGTTFRKGATGREECVPKFEQMGIDVGQKILQDDTMFTQENGLSLDDCRARCGPAPNAGCFMEFTYGYFNSGVNVCRYAFLTSNTDGVQPASAPGLLYVKQIPSDAIGATSTNGDVDAKAMSSGLYARLTIPTAWSLANVGTTLAGGAFTLGSGGVDLDLVKSKCDMNSRCWGFTVDGTSAVLRGGSDAQDVRTFYVNPSNPEIQSW